jgi:hypothetical protein
LPSCRTLPAFHFALPPVLELGQLDRQVGDQRGGPHAPAGPDHRDQPPRPTTRSAGLAGHSPQGFAELIGRQRLPEELAHPGPHAAENQLRVAILGHGDRGQLVFAGLDQRRDRLHHRRRIRIEVNQQHFGRKLVQGLGQERRLVDLGDDLDAGDAEEVVAQLGCRVLVGVHHDDPDHLTHRCARPV